MSKVNYIQTKNIAFLWTGVVSFDLPK